MVLHCSFFWDTMVNLNHLWYLSRASTLVVTWVSGGSIRVKVGYLHTTHYVNICSAGEGTAVWIGSSSCKIYTFVYFQLHFEMLLCILFIFYQLFFPSHLFLSETSGSLHL